MSTSTEITFPIEHLFSEGALFWRGARFEGTLIR